MKTTNIIWIFFTWMAIWIINNIKMLYYDSTDVSEEIDVNKTSKSESVIFFIIGIF